VTGLKRIAFLVLPLAFSATAMAAEGTNAGETGGSLVWWISPIAAILALGFAFYFYKKMMEAPEGTDKMIEIARHVREGAYAYLFRQYSVVTLVFIVLLAIFAFLAYKGVQNPFVPVAFLTGGFFSGLCGFLGMKTATNASARTAQGASKSLNSGLQVAFRSGAVMGLVVRLWSFRYLNVVPDPGQSRLHSRAYGKWIKVPGTTACQAGNGSRA
jgi:K(+)-stimulated pyrophosphate-energized sodium pump